MEDQKKIWDTYYDELNDTSLTLTPKKSPGNKLAYHLFPILINKNTKLSRDELLVKLNNAGIGCGVHYESIPSHPYYKKQFGWNATSTPKAYKFGKSVLSLPITPVITENELDYIINTIKRLLK